MKKLSQHLTSAYIEAMNTLSGKKSRQCIVVYVESYDDIFFWSNLLRPLETDRVYFEVMLPSRTSLCKGKKIALSNDLGERLGRCMIACVDADYVKKIRGKIIALGGDIRFESRLTGICLKEDEPDRGQQDLSPGALESKKYLTALKINSGERMICRRAVIAPGNSARDTFRMLFDSGVQMEAKPFSVGVRIEHPQSVIDLAQYGVEPNGEEGRLGAASYKLSYHSSSGRGVYTFCMCPGGYVVGAASCEGGVVTNGMSYHDRAGKNANSALLTDVRPEDFQDADKNPLAGIDFQEALERAAFEAGGGHYRAPVQRVGDFLEGRDSPAPGNGNQRDLSVLPTYRPGVRWFRVTDCLPEYVTEAMREALPEMARRIRGFDMADAVMTGVETRSSAPVRILRDQNLQSVSVSGLYPGGEGAGYAGGIMSAAVDGIKIAEKIIEEITADYNFS